ncbi:MAG: dihydroxyacetone kinase subunit L [Lachnospiraceae bacterium]
MDINMNKTYLIKLLNEMQKAMCENKDYLIQLDSVVGDGDLGLTMSDGFVAAYQAAKKSDDQDVGKLLYQAGKAMSIAVPSTMGTLMASGWMQAGKELKGKTELTEFEIVEVFEAYEEGVIHRGKAKVGDKTFLDGLHPAVEKMKSVLANGGTLLKAAESARKEAEKGFENTTTMLAVHGRAATRGEASRKLEDPGAAVAVLMMKAFEKSLY